MMGCGEVSKNQDAGMATDTRLVDLPKDAPIPDGPHPDSAYLDKAQPDGPNLDLSVKDLAPADSAQPDLAIPDLFPLDMPSLDMLVPDKLSLDQPIPDLTVPDQLTPDQSLPPDMPILKTITDDTFADFIKGTLSESGAKIYVSAKGNVQMLDRLDINVDGYIDLAFSNTAAGPGIYNINSYIYWGSQSGFSPTNKFDLPSQGGHSCSIADFNDDGFPDISITNYHDNLTYKLNSYIYWGSSAGLSISNRTNLPTIGAGVSSTADINGDGYIDIVFSNKWASPGTTNINSYIYWNSGVGFSTTNRTELPTLGAIGNLIADLNQDGYLDVVFSNGSNSGNPATNSYIYWGAGAKAFSKVQELPTLGASSVSTADLNKDGHLDLVFSNFMGNSTTYTTNSYVYFGSSAGFSTGSRKELPTVGSTSNSIADINSDGYLDIIFSNAHDGASYKTNSYIYKGSSGGFNVGNRSELPTQSGSGNLVVDIENDGYLDIVFANSYNDSSYKINSYIYHGSSLGYSNTNRTFLPTNGASYSVNADPGSLFNRRPLQWFMSRITDTKIAAPSFSSLSWTAKVPHKTILTFQIRSAATVTAMSNAIWYGPTTTSDYYKASTSTSPTSTTNSTGAFTLNKVHNGHRYIQYKAIFEQGYDFTNTPVLDRVSISYF